MLFHSSLRRELARSFGASLLVLLTIVVTFLLIRTLGLANKGSVNPQEIMLVLTYTVLARLPMVLTLALVIAIVGTLSRMYRESEMAIWFSSGVGLGQFVRPVLRFAWPVWAVIAALVFAVGPWVNAQNEILRDRYERRGDLERIAPGQFQESANGQKVFFIEKDSNSDKEGNNIFIASSEPDGRQIITSARSGRVEWRDNTQFLLLKQGQRIEQPGTTGQGKLTVSDFEEYGIKIGQADGLDSEKQTLQSVPTWALLPALTPDLQGELAGRIGMAVAAVNLVLLALAVAGNNPRSGKNGSQVFMLLVFVVYQNILSVGKSWVAAEQVAWLPFLLVLHGGVLLMTLLWLSKRHFNWHWQLPRRRTAKEAA